MSNRQSVCILHDIHFAFHKIAKMLINVPIVAMQGTKKQTCEKFSGYHIILMHCVIWSSHFAYKVWVMCIIQMQRP